ncbi:MAG TPA: SsgA family sporulation/cell division regulator [Mycobacteriales bacterium]|nr:SsgA family sporulation/cell division regulator [Mycobacteriales bacterium]
MNIHPDTARARLVLRMLGPDGSDRPVRADLAYRPDDPYAVRVAFHAGSDDVVEWTFARQLLSDGVTRPTGDGDVRVWPTEDRSDGHGVCLSLSSPSGQAIFSASPGPIKGFLSQTYTMVPPGGESNFIDLDAELELLLTGD